MMGIHAYKAATKTTLEARHIKARRVWERWMRPMDVQYWQGVVFSDETRIYKDALHPSVKVKRPKNSRYDPRYFYYSEKYGGGGISFWGAITYWGPGPLYRLYGSMDSPTYTNILGILKLDLQEMGIHQFILQDDNLTAHRTPLVEQMKETLVIETIPSWPANSPDLSPIENIWGIWKTRVHARQPRNLVELEAVAVQVWDDLEPELFTTLYNQMPHRLALLRQAKGRRIKC